MGVGLKECNGLFNFTVILGRFERLEPVEIVVHGNSVHTQESYTCIVVIQLMA